jgi:hypothetical protein
MSCQFGMMFAEPAAPHTLQTRLQSADSPVGTARTMPNRSEATERILKNLAHNRAYEAKAD